MKSDESGAVSVFVKSAEHSVFDPAFYIIFIIVIIFADEGKILTEGEVFGTTISLEAGKTAENFYEITKEEYEKLQEEAHEH